MTALAHGRIRYDFFPLSKEKIISPLPGISLPAEKIDNCIAPLLDSAPYVPAIPLVEIIVSFFSFL